MTAIFWPGIMVLTQISPSAFNRIKKASCFLILFFKGNSLASENE